MTPLEIAANIVTTPSIWLAAQAERPVTRARADTPG